jgi:hypothetical protein
MLEQAGDSASSGAIHHDDAEFLPWLRSAFGYRVLGVNGGGGRNVSYAYASDGAPTGAQARRLLLGTPDHMQRRESEHGV